MSKVLELFGYSTELATHDWADVVKRKNCPFLGEQCEKNRKSDPKKLIGTCTVTHGGAPVVICPHRFLEEQIIFKNCISLIQKEPSDEIRLIRELKIPGGKVDYIIASIRNRQALDFVGIEIQTVDTTGTLWPERQRFLQSKGLPVKSKDIASQRSYGMNWKMTAKTILVQLLHKIGTFENANRHLVLALQDVLLDYIAREFKFDHIGEAKRSDPLQIHVYSLAPGPTGLLQMSLTRRLSTNTIGVATALGLRKEARMDSEQINQILEKRISEATRLNL